MLSDDRTQVKSRFFNSKAENDPTKITINVQKSDNAIGRVFDSKIPALINNYSHRQWRDIITKELAEFIQDGSLAIIPVKIGDKAIGVVCAQYFFNQQKVEKKQLKKTSYYRG
jgi:transcriptional regulator with GAF, ATPase, and Fis domain